MAKLTIDEVIARFRTAHEDTYTYDSVDYAHQHTKVEITCNEHGPFYMTPVHHWSGIGCKPCSEAEKRDVRLKKFLSFHGDKFDYSKVDFKDMTTPVTIICRTHGEFTIRPVNHMNTSVGCKSCARDLRKANTAATIVARFEGVHGDRYDYSEFRYDDMHITSTISCKAHGPFPMTPANHLSDHGCPSCWQNTASKPEIAWISSIKDLSGWAVNNTTKVVGVIGAVDSIFEPRELDKPVVIEYDGNYWHSRSDSMRKDTEKSLLLSDLGYLVVRLRVEGKYVLPDVPSAHLNFGVSEYPSDTLVQELIETIKEKQNYSYDQSPARNGQLQA